MFFDLDGTLHQQDMFGTFLRCIAAASATQCAARSAAAAGYRHCVTGKRTGRPLADEPAAVGRCTFGHSEARLKALEKSFVTWVSRASPPSRWCRIEDLLSERLDADIWLITGLPQPLVEQVYFDTPGYPAST